MIALAKDAIDVGLFTEELDESVTFWRDDVGLSYSDMIPVGGGVRQHRFTAGDSVVKVNHSKHPLPVGSVSTLAAVLVTLPGAPSPRSLATPDGVAVEVLPGSAWQTPTVSVVVRTPRHADVAAFWSRLGLERHILVEDDAFGLYHGDLRAIGFRFLTAQVRDVHAAHAELVAAGFRELAAPTRLGDVAAISFVADPDGVPIEISQRASLVGHLPD